MRAFISTSVALLTAIGLLGCAEVRPPAAAAPRTAVHATASDPSLPVEDDAQPVSYDDASVAETDDASAEDHEDEDDGHEFEDDGVDETVDIMACMDRGPGTPPHCPQYTWKSPLEGLAASEIRKKVKEELTSVGPISLGPPNGGRLFNGVRMPDNDKWSFTDPNNAYGTQETVDSITKAIEKVFAKHADSPKVIIGHLSSKSGGHLRPHKSHQSGRDVDLSYFYKDKVGWYAQATAKNLDRPRTWTFVKAFLEDPNTEMVLVDTRVQRLLYDYALEQGEDKAFLDKAFQIAGKNPRAIIRHVKGHATHIHVRFFSPSAQASGKLAQAYLPKPAPPPKRGKGKRYAKGDVDGHDKRAKSGRKTHKNDDDFVYHRCRSGDTLGSLSRRYGVSIQAIKTANGLKSNAIKQKHTYRIPKASKRK